MFVLELQSSITIASTVEQQVQTLHSYQELLNHTAIMSMFGFGGARPQPSSAEKIAAAEAEIEMVSNMFNQYAPTQIA